MFIVEKSLQLAKVEVGNPNHHILQIAYQLVMISMIPNERRHTSRIVTLNDEPNVYFFVPPTPLIGLRLCPSHFHPRTHFPANNNPT